MATGIASVIQNVDIKIVINAQLEALKKFEINKNLF